MADNTQLVVIDEDFDETYDPFDADHLARANRRYKEIRDEELDDSQQNDEENEHQQRMTEIRERIRQQYEVQQQRSTRKTDDTRQLPRASSQDFGYRTYRMQYPGNDRTFRETAPPSLDGPYGPRPAPPSLDGPYGSRPAYERQYTHRRKPLAMPDMYNGKTSWLDYVAHFESCALLNEWTEEDMVAFLRTRLSGVARRTLKSVLTTKHQTYDQIITALGNRFEPEDREDLYLSQLRARRKLHDEKLEDLADDIRRLCELAYPTYDFEALERVGRNHFLDAISDPQLRHDISLSGAKTLTRAAQVASEREAFLEGERMRTGTQKVQSFTTTKTWDQEKQEMQAKIDAMAGELKKWKQKATQNGKQTPKPRADKSQQPCYYCGKLGHYSFECRKRQADEQYQEGYQQQSGNGNTRGRGNGWRGRGRGRGSWRGRGRGRGRSGSNNFNSTQDNNRAGEQPSQRPQADRETTNFQEN